MEELVPVHPEPAREHVGDRGDRRRDWRRRAVEIQLGVGQPARDAIPMRAELELQVYVDDRARAGTVRTNRLSFAARGGSAIERPGDRLE
jgi:hypothetical protein